MSKWEEMSDHEKTDLIATHVMGWQIDRNMYYRPTPDGFAQMVRKSDWNPFNSISDAWNVVEELRTTGFGFTLQDSVERKWRASFELDREYEAYADTEQMAICLASLKSRGVLVNES